MHPSQYLRSCQVRVTVAYPILPGIYGTNDLDDVEKTIRADAAQIRDALFSSGNYVSGQEATLPQPSGSLPPPDSTEAQAALESIGMIGGGLVGSAGGPVGTVAESMAREA
jgi:hypothetical protein